MQPLLQNASQLDLDVYDDETTAAGSLGNNQQQHSMSTQDRIAQAWIKSGGQPAASQPQQQQTVPTFSRRSSMDSYSSTTNTPKVMAPLGQVDQNSPDSTTQQQQQNRRSSAASGAGSEISDDVGLRLLRLVDSDETTASGASAKSGSGAGGWVWGTSCDKRFPN